MRKINYDLDDRLIDFGVLIIEISETVDKTRDAARYLGGQLVRSGTSPGLHYGEAQAAESRKDFIHKMKVIHKELNETCRNLKMIKRARLHLNTAKIESVLDECNELSAIIGKSIITAKRNADQQKN